MYRQESNSEMESKKSVARFGQSAMSGNSAELSPPPPVPLCTQKHSSLILFIYGYLQGGNGGMLRWQRTKGFARFTHRFEIFQLPIQPCSHCNKVPSEPGKRNLPPPAFLHTLLARPNCEVPLALCAPALVNLRPLPTLVGSPGPRTRRLTSPRISAATKSAWPPCSPQRALTPRPF